MIPYQSIPGSTTWKPANLRNRRNYTFPNSWSRFHRPNLVIVKEQERATLQKMPFLNCVTVTQNMCIDGFLRPILRRNILARDDV